MPSTSGEELARLRLIIDTDTASDDAVALLIALGTPGVTVEAITVVAGNVPLAQACRNALATLDVAAGPDVPVYVGAAGPLRGQLRTAQNVHGEDGMGGTELPPSNRSLRPLPAPEAIARHAGAGGGEPITLVTLGPLTNVALALDLDPELPRRVAQVVVMGGTSDHLGNVTPVAEYNFWADPEAARRVLQAGWPIRLVGWDISRKYAVLSDGDCAALRAIGTAKARFAVDINRAVRDFCRRVTRIDGVDCPDPVTMAIALDPSLATSVARAFVDVELAGEWTRGQTVIDYLGITGRAPNAEVVLEANREGFLRILERALGS